MSKDNGKTIVFVDAYDEKAALSRFRSISFAIAFICIATLMIAIPFATKKALRPIADSLEKQKRFVTDAGHEIKTPLAIMSANLDVITLDNGENEWVEVIRNQIKRLNDLVKHMLMLAKLDEEEISLTRSTFSISKALCDTLESFSPIAKKGNYSFDTNIQDGIFFVGDEHDIRELLNVLVDNSLKYSPDNSTITVKLMRHGKNIIFEISNALQSSTEIDTKRIFDRFYRADTARTRSKGESGGTGIGLSIAQAIVEGHKGKISAVCEKNAIKFRVIFP